MAHGHDFGIETPHTGSISDRGYTRILQMNTGFSVQNMYEVFVQRLDPVVPLRGSYALRPSGGMEENPHHVSSSPFYLHGSGLTLVALETACVYPTHITFLMVRNLG
jgi:hypothetical protein